MDKTTVRSWDPSAPSLLWAHQIRRENIHLVNQLDSTRADLAGAILAITELKQQLNEVREQAQTANTNHDACDRRLKDITDRIETRLEGISSRIDAIERENGRLRESLDGIEPECREQTGLDELGKSIQRQVLDEVRVWFTREKEVLQGRVGGPEGGDPTGVKQASPEPDVVPDSMRLDESAPFARKDSLRSLTETTWGSSNHSQQSPNQVDLQLEKERVAEHDSAMLPQIRQGGRDLEDYLSSVEDMRAQLSPRKREGEIVEAFVRGLYDAGTRGRVEGEMDRAGWSWDTLAKIVRNEIEKQHRHAVERKRAAKGDVEERVEAVHAPGEVHISRPRKKQRRFIPIVPADEDDLIV
ncbi:uncharacterized protein NFIA_068990 [Aspergillus fischeri NRRL 181]|uniref:Uncharacterized protein n=1 Tax=Neosartorya fischeri (strain ATCC 1020 / DSM 3700 / CBS 544.65 / FGSC A1164 / JCM 1740 / NRRL 181 / WB 181) TaxID=331117 RepID=A1D7N4_NEOFI|nr:conserved hypothetical protein [Aspergillus fischeri NRRL 181]EAW21728.1 conserved hypothetical protein [Aspergillus fischeri NRRL 181]